MSMRLNLQPTRIKAPVTSGGFAARGSVVSPYYPRAWGANITIMTLKCFITGYSGGNQVQMDLIASDNSINATVGMPLTIVYSDTDATIRAEIETLISNYCTGFFGIQAPDIFVWNFTTPTDLAAAIASVAGATSYQTIVSQTGTAAPAVSGGFTPTSTYGATTFTWARTGAGVYTLTANAAVFSTSKTGVFITPPQNLNGSFRAVVTSSTVITVTTAVQSLAVLGLLGFTAVNTDALLNNTMIYVQTYS